MLPIKTAPSDASRIVDYLKTKATGATLAEAKVAVDKKLLDSRKINAFITWEFVTKDKDKFKLTDRGRRFARASSDQRKAIFAEVVSKIRPYRLTIEWMFHQNFDSVSTVELAAHWHEHISGDLGSTNETTIREQVNCFFNLSAGAGLGEYIIGRNKQPTRFEIDRDALGQLIGESHLQPDNDEDIGENDELGDSLEEDISVPNDPSSDDESSIKPDIDEQKLDFSKENKSQIEDTPQTLPSRVFISHGKNIDIVEQIKTMLDLADLAYDVVVEEETTAIPVPDKVLAGMRRCTAAVICVTANEDMLKEDGSYGVNQNVLIEVGAAFVLYEKRVVLVWDKRISVPSNLQGLYRCEFEGDELSWSAGMKLMKAVNQFKKT